MRAMPASPNATSITLESVNSTNWRGVAQLTVSEAQHAFVAVPSYYLALCAYDQLWQPLAVRLGEEVIGFLMWAVDPADGSCWLGGILIDQHHQGRGYGKQAVRAAIALLHTQHGYQHFALSYQPTNLVAKQLYATLGFAETGEIEGDEVVARLGLGV